MKWWAETAEFVGTFLLVFCGCGAIMTDAISGDLGLLGIAAVFGLTVAALVYAIGHVSGAHINPAVTIAFAVAGDFPWRRVATYVAAQMAGATLAAFTLRQLLGPVGHIGATLPRTGFDASTVFALELVMTFLLTFVIAGAACDTRAARSHAGLAIGGVVALLSLFGGPLTGTSINPARTLGPALADGNLAWVPVYIAAPIVGGIAGMLCYGWLQRGAVPGSDDELLRVKEAPLRKLLQGDRS